MSGPQAHMKGMSGERAMMETSVVDLFSYILPFISFFLFENAMFNRGYDYCMDSEAFNVMKVNPSWSEIDGVAKLECTAMETHCFLYNSPLSSSTRYVFSSRYYSVYAAPMTSLMRARLWVITSGANRALPRR